MYVCTCDKKIILKCKVRAHKNNITISVSLPSVILFLVLALLRKAVASLVTVSNIRLIVPEL